MDMEREIQRLIDELVEPLDLRDAVAVSSGPLLGFEGMVQIMGGDAQANEKIIRMMRIGALYVALHKRREQQDAGCSADDTVLE